ncbi:MAG: BadF/BadG/BcrA/BcrD ATPase family protein [Chloroflexota bacterium]
MSELILGIDGGGTKTVCVLADDRGKALGRGRSGSSNYNSVGIERARRSILEAVAGAFAAAGLAEREVGAICLGLAGVDRPTDVHLIQEAMGSANLARKVVIVNDAEVALAGATESGLGVVVIAGTGSIAFGINRRGEKRRAGGWGPILGDEGSGYAIGLGALVSILKSHDGRGPRTSLTPLIMERWKLSRIDDIVGRVYVTPPPRLEIAALAPVVAKAARAGDEVARDIWRRAGLDLAHAAVAVIRGLGMTQEVFEVATAGSVFKAGELILSPFRSAIRDVAKGASVVKPRSEPVMGAVRLALAALEPE